MRTKSLKKKNNRYDKHLDKQHYQESAYKNICEGLNKTLSNHCYSRIIERKISLNKFISIINGKKFYHISNNKKNKTIYLYKSKILNYVLIERSNVFVTVFPVSDKNAFSLIFKYDDEFVFEDVDTAWTNNEFLKYKNAKYKNAKINKIK